MTTGKPCRTRKLDYTEAAAAELLGITRHRLRTLIRTHIWTEQDGPLEEMPLLQPCDIVVLQFLASKEPQEALEK
jgi:hypothetical protein